VDWALLDGLTAEQKRGILAEARRRKFARREVIFHEGDPGDSLHLIERGHVTVRVTSPLGDTATLRILGPGEYFGELAVISPASRNATITALDAVETLSLHRDQMNRLRREHPAIEQVLLGAVVQEVRRLSASLLDAMYVPAAKRLARQLVNLAQRFPADANGRTTIPLTQDDLAGLCGTARPTVNQMLAKLSERNLVDVARGRVVVIDLSALIKQAR
jgi:CRP/FNR family transcriptional regulator, cyclic AMP receptor protein